ncbi:bifunctional tRNA (5-methylaminomethyl-2-thiouridine)(34)-methyltransferase MnmD/FAD-dependent 5-carboxymethylaminomethyl-2-thiouridine(34) oxidoreductase MnmC [Halomonas shantousis]
MPDDHAPSPLPPLAALDTARLDWQRADDDDPSASPFSSDYGDVYFSRQDGRAETTHVFLAQNRLPERFSAWREFRPFVIGETGFGTGLNMLCAWECFDRHAPPGARLHLVSTEKHPFERDALARALTAWPDLAGRAEALIGQWPAPVTGLHRLVLSERVTLDLHFGDAAERLSRLDGRVDAWFLDGFAPSKNPDMWTQTLFDTMAARSHPDATFATFTCAGFVRRGLTSAGFRCEKVPGYGRKREMLRGAIGTPPDDTRRQRTPWFTPPQTRPVRHVAVIGAGIAGSSVAYALARRGVTVTLIDRHTPGSGASGNRQGALYVKLAAETNLQSRFYLAGLMLTRRWLEQLDPQHTLWQDCGVLQLAAHDKESRRQSSFLARHPLPDSIVHGVDSAAASAAAGTPLAHEAHAHAGLAYPQAGWVRPAALCQRLAATPGIRFLCQEVTTLTPEASGWRLTLADGTVIDCDQAVVATAHAASGFAPLAHLPLKPIRGQVSELALPAGAPALKQVVCAGGYVSPALNDVLCFGATFAPGDTDMALREADHAANLAELEQTLPAFVAALREAGAELSPEALDGRVGLRAASPDKSPFAGPAPDASAWQRDYAALGRNARRAPEFPGVYHPGLWVSAAHGSRGLASAPLCAEIIASRLCGEPMPLERELIDHVHPGRRLIADLIQGKAGRSD